MVSEDFLETITGVGWASGDLWCGVMVTRPQGGGFTTEAQVSFPVIAGGTGGVQLLNGVEVTAPYLSTPHRLTASDLKRSLVTGAGFGLTGFRLKAVVEPSLGNGNLFFKISGNKALETAKFTLRTTFIMSPLDTTSLVVSLYNNVVKADAQLVGNFDGGLPFASRTTQKFYDGTMSPVTQDCLVDPKTFALTFL